MSRELPEALDHVDVAAQQLLEVEQRIRKRRGLAVIERTLERALAKAWGAQGRDFGRRFAGLSTRFQTEALREAITPDDWEPLFTATELATLQAFSEPLSIAARAALRLGARHAIADLGLRIVFGVGDPEAVAYLARVGAERVAGINDTTRDRLRTLLTEARAGGWSYDKTAVEIRRTFAGFGSDRAHLVAVTETGDAYEAARRAMADRLSSSGLDMEKSWLAVGDERTDADCLANDAQGWIPITSTFASGHDQPTAHPGCRCTTEYRRVRS